MGGFISITYRERHHQRLFKPNSSRVCRTCRVHNRSDVFWERSLQVILEFCFICKLIKTLQMIPICYRYYSNAEVCNFFINKLYYARTHSVSLAHFRARSPTVSLAHFQGRSRRLTRFCSPRFCSPCSRLDSP